MKIEHDQVSSVLLSHTPQPVQGQEVLHDTHHMALPVFSWEQRWQRHHHRSAQITDIISCCENILILTYLYVQLKKNPDCDQLKFMFLSEVPPPYKKKK